MPTGRVRWFDAAKGYGFITSEDGRRGPQAMDVRLIASAPSLVKATRPKADDMAAICEDLIKMLDAAGNTLRRHRYPSAADSKKLATLLRAVADQFDVQD